MCESGLTFQPIIGVSRPATPQRRLRRRLGDGSGIAYRRRDNRCGGDRWWRRHHRLDRTAFWRAGRVRGARYATAGRGADCQAGRCGDGRRDGRRDARAAAAPQPSALLSGGSISGSIGAVVILWPR